MEIPKGKYIGSVKVGPKGQIVIPKEVRDIFGIVPGDTLILVADDNQGIAIQSMEYFSRIADAIFATPEGGNSVFATAVRNLEETKK